MAKSRDSYRVTGTSADQVAREVNFLFQRIADRMDKIEGIRGTSSIESDLEMNSNRIREVGEGIEADDAARVDGLIGIQLAVAILTVSNTATINNLEVEGDLKVYDPDGILIHSME